MAKFISVNTLKKTKGQVIHLTKDNKMSVKSKEHMLKTGLFLASITGRNGEEFHILKDNKGVLSSMFMSFGLTFAKEVYLNGHND
jgi:hypothetical protein